MNRYQIVRAFNMAASCSLSLCNTHVSSINSGKDVWWYDLPSSKFYEYATLHLLAFDQHKNQVHRLDIPTKFLRENVNCFDHKKDGSYIRIELSTDKSKFLRDVRPGGEQLDFAQFHNHTV
jgi:hypothetical protein